MLSGKVIKIAGVGKKITEALLNKVGPKDLAGTLKRAPTVAGLMLIARAVVVCEAGGVNSRQLKAHSFIDSTCGTCISSCTYTVHLYLQPCMHCCSCT